MKKYQVHRLVNTSFPYIPGNVLSRHSIGNGCVVPYPRINSLDVGFVRDRKCPGNIVGEADGGRWVILQTWATGWMSVYNIVTGTVLSSTPPGMFAPIEGEFHFFQP